MTEYDFDLNEDNVSYKEGFLQDEDAISDSKNPEKFGFYEISQELEERAISSYYDEATEEYLIQQLFGIKKNPEEGPPVLQPPRTNSNTIRMAIEREIQDRPYIAAYTAAFLLLMVGFHLSEPLFTLLGAGLAILTAFHYGN